MKDKKLYNVIFPIWLLLFIPPLIFITLIGNFIIDSIVVIICFKVFKTLKQNYDQKQFYRKSIIKVWLYGFLADFIGAIILILFIIGTDHIEISNDIINGITFNPFTNIISFIIVTFVMLVSTLMIFIFNYHFVFNKIIDDQKVRFKVALIIAFVTTPWTFLLPTSWFY